VTAAVVQHTYEPRGAARRLVSARDGEILVDGPAGTGKSLGCLHKIAMCMMKYDGARALIVRKTAASLGSTTLETWRKQVIKSLIASGKAKYYGGSTEEPPQYRFANGSAVVIGGMDKPSKIMSSEYDLVFADEGTELDVADWEAATTRLRHGVMPYQQALMAVNPAQPTHWVNQRADAGLMLRMLSRHEDNPRYFRQRPDGTFELTPDGAAYLDKLDRLTGVRYQRLRKGLWVAAEGQIFEDFDPAVHLVDAMPAGWERWPRYWSIDWGHTNPCVVGFWAEDGDGRLYLYRELYHTQRLVEDVARQVMRIVAPADVWREPQPEAIVCDHDAEDRHTFERHTGLGTIPAKKDVTNGIQAVQARLRPAGDGRPRIFLLRSALVERDAELAEAGKPVCTADEIPGYVWKPGPDGKPVPEEPLKKDDHGCDAARYLVMHKDWGSGEFFRGWF
jgi:PBSX family phage terminase large subunit